MLREMLLVLLILMPCVIAEASDEQKELFDDKGKINSDNLEYAQNKIIKKYKLKGGFNVIDGDYMTGDNYHTTRYGIDYNIPLNEFKGSRLEFTKDGLMVDGKLIGGPVKGLHKNGDTITVESAGYMQFEGNTFTGITNGQFGPNGFNIEHADHVLTQKTSLSDATGVTKMGDTITVEQAPTLTSLTNELGDDVAVLNSAEETTSEESDSEQTDNGFEQSPGDLTDGSFDYSNWDNHVGNQDTQAEFSDLKDGTFVTDENGDLASATAISEGENTWNMDDSEINLGENDLARITRNENGKLEITTESGSATVNDNGQSVSVVNLWPGDSFRANENDPHYPYGVHASTESPGPVSVFVRRDGEEKNYADDCTSCVSIDLDVGNVRFSAMGEFEVKQGEIFGNVLKVKNGEADIELNDNKGHVKTGANLDGQVWSRDYEARFSPDIPGGRGFRFDEKNPGFVSRINDNIRIDEKLVAEIPEKGSTLTMSTI